MMHAFRRLLLISAAAALLPGELAAQQPALISGHVTSESGALLGGAQVSVPSLGIGATARGDGAYTILVPEARIPIGPVTVTARLIGYALDSVEVTLTGGSATADFVLAINPFQLGEVVVTGAGTSSDAEKLGTVRDHIDAATIVHANEQNLVNALAVKAPNVTVTSASGDPGASSHIQLRGLTTIEASDGQPLFVVDGVPVDNSTTYSNPALEGQNDSHIFPPNRLLDLNPDDIESIEILKGAASGAIYGSRAGQGVVLITTKRPRPGQTSYSLRSSWSLDQHTQLPALQTEYGLGTQGSPEVCAPSTDPSLLDCRTGTTGSYGPKLPASTPVYDHADEMFRNGLATDNTLTLSGGSDQTQFFLSGGYSYNRGIVVGDNNHYRRISVRANGLQQITGRLKVGLNLAYSSGSGAFVTTRNNTAGLLLGGWRTPPEFNNLPYLDPVFGLQRSYRFPNPGPGSARHGRGYDNPFFTANENPATSDVSRIFGGFNAEWGPTSWFKIDETLGLDDSNEERFESWAWSNSNCCDPPGLFGVGGVNAGYIRNQQLDHNLTATATYGISSAWKGTITLGQNLNSQTFRGRQTLGAGLITPQPFNLANTSELVAPVYDHLQQVHLESYFAQMTADLFGHVFVTAAIRNDGASSFGEGSRRHWFPKGSVAWVFRAQEGTRGFISYGKLRAAYGQSGTQPPPYLLASLFTPTPSGIVGGELVSGPKPPSASLGPERVKEFEAGGDLGLWGEKADLSVTHYRQNTTDAILQVPMATSTGYVQVAANAASLQNRGWEVTLNLRPVNSRKLGWDLGFQWARNRGVTTALAPGLQFYQFPYSGGGGGAGPHVGAVAQPGQPIGAYRGTDFVRCGRGLTVDGIDIDNTPGQCQGAPGGALYIAEDGFPREDLDSTWILGNPNPDWTGSLRTTFRIGKLSIGGLLDIRAGGIAYNGTKGALQQFGVAKITAETRNGAPVAFGTDYYPSNADEAVNPTHAVAGPGVGMKVPLDEAWWTGEAGVFQGVDVAFLEPGHFVKLREVSIGYTLDRPWVSHSLGFSSIELRLAGRNLVSWNDYTGVDPETSLIGAVTPVPGINYFNNPQTRSWVFTIALKR
jgi:TonB-linked SusC/RagA family outer membrane protein